MSDSVRITNLPDSGSTQRVAYDLMTRIWHFEGSVKMTRADALDLYAQCLDTVAGARSAPRV